MTDIDRDTALSAKSWPFVEARKVLERLGGRTPEKGHVLFETGYGPSGLPHIGTFGEVCRTTMVMHAFRQLSDIPAKLVSFSDDMDGLRKVPENVPNREVLAGHIGMPLSRIPDPFGEHESFAHHNNARLRSFLDSFGFEYEFISSTEMYVSGKKDAGLLRMLEAYEEVRRAVLPLLGEERAASYSPFLPLSPKTGKVLQVPILEVRPEAGTIVFEDEDGTKAEVPVTGGHCKAQWRPDWALHWYALDTDYEMAGEDLESSRDMACRILRILGKEPPAGFHYKLFLDEQGQKISKSKGNGLSMEEWLRYAPAESLSYYMFLKPGSGKKLYFDIIPRAVDEYITFVEKWLAQDAGALTENPAWFIHQGKLPNSRNTPVSFALLLNLASAADARDRETMWGFISRYAPGATPETTPFLDDLVGFAVRYYEDFVKPAKTYRAPDERERAALADLAARLEVLPKDSDFEAIQTEVFSAGKENGYEKSELKSWFQAIYEVCLGQSQGPRFGSFAELYGLEATARLIRDALEGKFARAAQG